MKNLLPILLLLVINHLQAQTKINKTVAIKAGQTINMLFDYPELVRISTWDKAEIQITGTVSINNGENDGAFILEAINSGEGLKLKGTIDKLKSLPHRITVTRGSEKMVFRSKAEMTKYEQEHGAHFDMINDGVDIDIFLEIKVPQNVQTKVESVYGMVEVRKFMGPLAVEATYGGVDAALTERYLGALTAETNYGEIYSNLELKLDGAGRDEAFHTLVSARPGSGPSYSFESKYGNVYLRKEN